MTMQRLGLLAIINIHRNVDVNYRYVLKLFLQLHLRKSQLVNLIYLTGIYPTVTGEIFRKKYFAFVDLNKTFDRVSRDVIWWAVRKVGVEEWLVKNVQSIYSNAPSQS